LVPPLSKFAPTVNVRPLQPIRESRSWSCGLPAVWFRADSDESRGLVAQAFGMNAVIDELSPEHRLLLAATDLLARRDEASA